MRKFLIANLLLSLLLSIPVLATSGDEPNNLRERLARNASQLAEFCAVEQRLAAKDPSAVVDLLAASEAGPSDAVQAEIDLITLRSRVGALQEILDARALEGPTPALAEREVETTRPLNLAYTAPANPVEPHTIAVAIPVQNAPVSNKQAFETEGFIADRSRLGRACWRGGRYLEGVAALEPIAGDSQADYWRARCLEKLARNKEALELYRKVIAASGESPEGRSAREDLEFLEWSIAHGMVTP
ncbi:MAG TPA: hypothetical protein VK843_05300 [Planctomycetota bacterium]|nr:hypothetical protein [Planctomycetota bacterium]